MAMPLDASLRLPATVYCRASRGSPTLGVPRCAGGVRQADIGSAAGLRPTGWRLGPGEEGLFDGLAGGIGVRLVRIGLVGGVGGDAQLTDGDLQIDPVEFERRLDCSGLRNRDRSPGVCAPRT